MKYYSSGTSAYEDIGESVLTSMNGLGMLSPGEYVVLVISASTTTDTTLVLLAEGQGAHVETIAPRPDIKALDKLRIVIEMSDGVYLRRNREDLFALFEVGTERRVSEWTSMLDIDTSKKIALPKIKTITIL